MFTAEDARSLYQSDLDERIERAVKQASGRGAYLRVHIDDPFVHTIAEELEKRGFKNIDVPDICISGDVYFEW